MLNICVQQAFYITPPPTKKVLFTTSTFTFLNNTGSLSAGVQGQAVVCDQFEMEEQLKYNNFASEITCVLLIFFYILVKTNIFFFIKENQCGLQCVSL